MFGYLAARETPDLQNEPDLRAGRPARGTGAPSPPPAATPLGPAFFDRDAQVVACDLLGKVLWHDLPGGPLAAAVVEAEAYYLDDRGSHASLGYTDKRRALFMPPGTIYMYYSRGGDSLNVSCAGAGNAVLVKAALPFTDGAEPGAMLAAMQRRNPLPSGRPRPPARLCAGQTLLCRALGLRVPDWDARPVGTPPLLWLDVGYRPRRLARTARLGIPPGRDEHLPYRFVDCDRTAAATRNPLARGRRPGPGLALLAVPPPPQPADWPGLLGRAAFSDTV